MKPSMAAKLAQLTRRRTELDSLLSDPDVTGNLDNYRKLTREHADLTPVVALYAQYTAREADAASAEIGADLLVLGAVETVLGEEGVE